MPIAFLTGRPMAASNNPPPPMLFDLDQLGIVLLVKKPNPSTVDRSVKGWVPKFKGEEPPF